MNSFVNQCISLTRRSVLVQPVRTTVNVRKPREPCFQKKKIMRMVVPVVPKPYDYYFPQDLKCRKQLGLRFQNQAEENPYERILANEIIDTLNKSKMILILHANSFSWKMLCEYRRTFIKAGGIGLHRKGKNTVRMAVENTKYEPILRLFESNTLYLSSPEIKVKESLQVLKKMPLFYLLGGIVENRFMSKTEIIAYSNLPDLTTARAQLVATLNLAASELVNNMNKAQTLTVSYLDQHVKLQSDEAANTNKQVESDANV